MIHLPRHCERSEAIQGHRTSFALDCVVAALLAMTVKWRSDEFPDQDTSIFAESRGFFAALQRIETGLRRQRPICPLFATIAPPMLTNPASLAVI